MIQKNEHGASQVFLQQFAKGPGRGVVVALDFGSLEFESRPAAKLGVIENLVAVALQSGSKSIGSPIMLSSSSPACDTALFTSRSVLRPSTRLVCGQPSTHRPFAEAEPFGWSHCRHVFGVEPHRLAAPSRSASASSAVG